MSPQDLLLSSASVSELLILGFVAELTDRLFLLELEMNVIIVSAQVLLVLTLGLWTLGLRTRA